MNLTNNQYEKEITLIDCFRFIWKWKLLIICFLAIWTIGVSFFIANTDGNNRKYRVEMVLEPGLKGIDENGKYIYIDSPSQIKALIEGEIIYDLIDQIPKKDLVKPTEKIKIFPSLSKYSNRLDVYTETSHAEDGLTILELLSRLITSRYAQIATNLKEALQKKIEVEKLKITSLKKKTEFTNQNLKRLKKLLPLIMKRKEVINDLDALQLSKKDKKKELNYTKGSEFILMYEADIAMRKLMYETDMVLKKHELENYYMTQMDVALSAIRSEEALLTEIDNEIESISKMILNYEKEKSLIKNIQIIVPPTAKVESPYKMVISNLPLIVLFGLFLSITISLLIEYIGKYRSAPIK